MKKTACLLLAAVELVLCLTGCTGGFPWANTEPTEPQDTIVYAYKSEVPTYTDDKEMPMIAFWSPPNTEEWYQSMVDCGFTAVVIDAKYGVHIDSEEMLDTLAICDKVGIDAYLAVGRGNLFYNALNYGQYESFKGLNTDEPNAKYDIDQIEKNMSVLYNSYPDQDVEYLTTFMPWLTDELEKDFLTDEQYVRD